MKKWHVHTPIESVNGTQVWEVEAETKEEAIEIVKGGGGDIAHEEIEVTHCGEPNFVEEAEPDPIEQRKQGEGKDL